MPCTCCGISASSRRSRRSGVRPGAYVFRLHDTGEVIQRFSLSEEHEQVHGAPYTQLHRADLHEMLAAKAREFESERGAAQSHGDGLHRRAPTASNCDLPTATSARGDILIGADGLKSVVRAQMFGDGAGDLHRRRRLARCGADRAAAEGFAASRSCRCSWGRTATSSATTCAAARCSISSASSRPTRSQRNPGPSSCRGRS